MIGPFLITNWVNKERLLYIFIFQGVAIIIWGATQFNFYISMIAVFLTGFTTTTIWSITYAFIQERVEQKYLGRVISYNDMIFMISNVATTFFIGVMADLIPLWSITIVLGSAFFIVAYYYKKSIYESL